MHELITAVGSGTGLSDEQVRYAFELALEQAVCEYYRIPECLVDLEDKIIFPSFQGMRDGELNNAGLIDQAVLYGERICPELAFSALPKNIINRCRQLFAKNLASMESAILYEKWKPRVRQAVEGVVCEVGQDKIMVRLEDHTRGLMLKPEWVPAEIPFYRENAVFWFYVSKVAQEKTFVTVYLSRGSKNFPAALIRRNCPWAKIRALKRIRGKKTWIKSSARIDQETIRALQRELKGEAIAVTY